MLKAFDNTALQRAMQLARETLDIEADALRAAHARLDEDDSIGRAVGMLLGCSGRVVVSGIGKSGHIARKIAATLSSTGTPAMFVHPAEAAHGDLGMVTAEDAFIAISYSGEAAELLSISQAMPGLNATNMSILVGDRLRGRCHRVGHGHEPGVRVAGHRPGMNLADAPRAQQSESQCHLVLVLWPAPHGGLADGRAGPAGRPSGARGCQAKAASPFPDLTPVM